MKHLSPAEFVDLLDGRLGTARVAHARDCGECRAQAEALRHGLADAAAAPGSEPSPLFWEHFSARVSEAIRKEPAPRGAAWSFWSARPVFPVSLAAAVVALVTLATLWTRPVVAPSGQSGTTAEIVGTVPDPVWADEELDSDEAWALVSAATDGIEWDEAADLGLAPRPGAAARAVDDLTDAERAELVRLIEDELRRTGA